MNKNNKISNSNDQHENESLLNENIQNLLKGFREEHNQTHKGIIEEINLEGATSGEYIGMIIFNLFFFLFIIPIFYGFMQIGPNEIIIVESLGKPVKLIKDAGLHWYFPCMNRFRKVNKSLTTNQLKGSSVPDLNGSPLNISVVITYSIQGALAATYNVVNEYNFLNTQALEVVRRVISKFKYRSNDPNEVTLLKDSMVLGKYMKELLNIKMKLAGIVVTRMELMEISYHPEIAQGMLQIQQANAKVEARKEIVKGGVEIVKDALDQLKDNNIVMSDKNKQILTKNLMIVVCSDVGKPQPVLNVK